MPSQPLTMSPAYLAAVRGLRELHELTAQGRLDSPEADAVRDATDTVWEALTDVEKKRIGGLSEDLYSITDAQPAAVKEMNPQAQARLVDIFQARQKGEWDRAFQLMRRWGAYIDPSLLNFLRGSTWLDAGDPATAVIFLEHATQLQPNDGNYQATYLDTLSKVSPGEARQQAVKILEAPEQFDPMVVLRASNILEEDAKKLPPQDAKAFFQSQILVLNSILERIEQGDEGGLDRRAFSLASALLASRYQSLGMTQAAIDVYSKAIIVDPQHDGLLAARAVLQYGKSPQAIDDFEKAIELGIPLLWPHFFLAHHNFITGQFERCRVRCERVLEMEAPDSIKSEAAEWLAISLFELGFPKDYARRSFDLSIRFDPTNERARRNLSILETTTSPVPVGRFETRSEAAIRATGLSERRLGRVA